MSVDSEHPPRVADPDSAESLDLAEIVALRSSGIDEHVEDADRHTDNDQAAATDQEEDNLEDPHESLDQRTQALRASVDRALAGLEARASAPRPYRAAALEAPPQPGTGWFAPHEKLTVRVVFGTVPLDSGTAAQLRAGSVVALDQLDGDPVDVYVNDWLAARGELQVWEGKFAVRIVERMEPSKEVTSK